MPRSTQPKVGHFACGCTSYDGKCIEFYLFIPLCFVLETVPSPKVLGRVDGLISDDLEVGIVDLSARASPALDDPRLVYQVRQDQATSTDGDNLSR